MRRHWRQRITDLEGRSKYLMTDSSEARRHHDRVFAMLQELAAALGYEWTYTGNAPEWTLGKIKRPKKGGTS